MAMTYTEFEMYAKNLIEISDHISDGWRELICSENRTIYLAKTQRSTKEYVNHLDHTDQKMTTSVSSCSKKHLRLEDVEIGLENADIGREEANIELENADIRLEDANIELKSADIGLEDADISLENADIGLENTYIGLKDANIELGNADIGLENANIDLENADIDLENADIGLEDANIGLEDDPQAHIPGDDGNSSLTWDYHVLFSSSYGVPVLYFNVWTPDGACLNLDQVCRTLAFAVDRWGALTQTEHPYLRKPFFQLHPCRTQNLIELVTNKGQQTLGHSNVNKLISWLSCIARYVHLDFPIEYGTAIKFL